MYLVWNPSGSKPMRVHNTYQLAREEACRLARKNVMPFYVLQAIERVRQKPSPPPEIIIERLDT